jgi:hypothetical protein
MPAMGLLHTRSNNPHAGTVRCESADGVRFYDMRKCANSWPAALQYVTQLPNGIGHQDPLSPLSHPPLLSLSLSLSLALSPSLCPLDASSPGEVISCRVWLMLC